MKVNDTYVAAYLKCNGFEVGIATFNKELGKPEVEIKGEVNSIQECINEYNAGGEIPASKFAKEVSFIKYLVTKRAR